MKTADYWKKRFEALEDEEYQKGQAYYRDLQNQFRMAQNSITLDIEHWYQRLADNNGVSLAAARRMLKKNELEEFRWNVWQYIKAGEENAVNGMWMKQLENASAKWHISYLEAMKIQTQQHCELLSAKYEKGLTEFLTNSYENDFYKTVFEIQKGQGVYANLTKIDKRKIDLVLTRPWAADGRNFSQRIWGNTQKLVKELHTELTQCIIRGESPKKAAERLAKTMNVSMANAERLIMTEMAAIDSQARYEAYKEMNVEQYEIVATLDSKTSEICQDMDNKVFNLDDWQIGVTAPPFHVRCRTSTAPSVDTKYQKDMERAARGEDGKTHHVPANISYKEWKKTYVDEGYTQEKLPLVEDEKGDITDTVNTARTKEQFETIANNIVSEIIGYTSNVSKWSGVINVESNLINGDAVGVKEWSCDISIIDTADDGVMWHEMLHSCSASYYDPSVYAANEFIEEASVEFLKQQICAEKNISNIPAYEDKVMILLAINAAFGYGTDMEFATELYNVPLPERYQWLEDKVDESLRVANASFQDYNDVMQFLEKLKGGKYGTIK